MRATKANKKSNKKQRSGRRRQQPVESLSVFGGALALPEEELRRLVWQITARVSVEPFVRQMIRLVDSLQAGRTRPLAHMLKQSVEPQDTRLLAAIADEVRSGSMVVARNTALWAAGCAYQNSLDYFLDLLSYLSRFRPERKGQPPPSPARVRASP